MKNVFITLAALVLSATAMATPAVGDKALYNTTVTDLSFTTYNYTQENFISSVDAVSGFFTIDNTVVYNGIVQTKSEQVNPNKMVTDNQVAYYVTNCVALQGALETVTVPAGIFDTCAVPIKGGTVWVANGVPFGIVKSDGVSTDGSKVYVELQSFVNGQ